MPVSTVARHRRRYLAAMGFPVLAAAPFAACTQTQPQLVSAPLYEGDAAALLASTGSDAGRLFTTTTATTKSFVADPAEPVPPNWPHNESKICRDDLDAPSRPELPSPFEACPKRGPNNAGFSAKATRAARADAPETCCYVLYTGMAVPGRALRDVEDRVVVAETIEHRDWCADVRPRVDHLSPDERAKLARAWLDDAALEHASIASFARFALELLALGASPDLVALAHAAAGDEIEHARLCYAIASAYSGRACGPGPLPLDHARAVANDFPSFARATFVDGCVGETIAAIEARARADAASDPVVRAALLRIARDEERHAELAWRALAWAVRTGGDAVRGALLCERDAMVARKRGVDSVAERAFASVIAPCVDALLSA
jgi:hypothetical protein